MRKIALLLATAVVALFTGCAQLAHPDPSPNSVKGGTGSGSGSGGSSTPISVAITNKFSSLNPGSAAVVVNATVSNDPANRGVTWTLTVSGSSCNTSTCGSLMPSAAPSFSASYLAPPALPPSGNLSATITATSVADSTKSDTFTFSFSSASQPGLFNGSYTLLVRGYDATGKPMAMAGTIVADGKGNLTGGELDLNIAGQVTAVASPLAGTYVIDSSFNKTIRGTLNITSFSDPAGNHISLQFALSSDQTRGNVIELDNIGSLNAGTMGKQDPSVLATASAAGTFAFGLDSDAPIGGRTVEAGQLIIAGGGGVSGLVDQSKAGAASPIYSAAPITAGNTTTADSLGRGTLSFTVNGNAVQYAYYLASSTALNLIEIDNGSTFGTVQAGIAHRQAPLTAGSVAATSILQMTGVDTVPGTQTLGPAVTIGQATISSGNAFSLTFDANDVGTVVVGRPAAGSVASFDPSTGRGTLSIPGGFASGFVDVAVFYLYDTGSAFLIDADTAGASASNRAYSGTLSLQSNGPFDSSLNGNLIAISGASATPGIPNVLAVANFANNGITAIADVTSLPSETGELLNRPFTGDFAVTNSGTGHGNASLPSGFFGNFALNQPSPATFYVIGPNQLVLIGTLVGSESGVATFSPE